MLGLEVVFAFITGGSLYGLIELGFRKRTHWTMLITGGICFAFMYLIATRTAWPLLIQCLAAATIVTAIEFIVGCIVNIRLRWGIWDYSNMRYNFMGQICPLFTGCWFLMSFPGIWLASLIKSLF